MIMDILAYPSRLLGRFDRINLHSILLQAETDALHDQFFIIYNQNLCHLLSS